MTRREILVSIIFDVILTQIAVLYSFTMRFGYRIPRHEFIGYVSLFPVFLIITPAVFSFFGIYRFNYRYAGIIQFLKIPSANFFALLFVTSAVFFTRNLSFSRMLLLYYFLLSSFFLICWRVILLTLAHINWQNKVLLRRLMIISFSGNCSNLSSFLLENPEFSYLPVITWPEDRRSVLTLGDEVLNLIDTWQIDEVFLDTKGLSPDDILKNTAVLQELGITFKLLPGFSDFLLTNFQIQELGGFLLLEPSRTMVFWEMLVKEISDYFFSFVLMLLLSPLLLMIMLMIKLLSPGGGVFYSQTRTGKGGRSFRILKFRTMNPGSAGPVLTGKNDPRVYPFGRFLRKWSLDELPQLINVLKGDMSLIGPRPEVPEITDSYHSWQKRVFRVKPGITGLSQVSGRAELSIIEKLKLDLYYIDNYSLLLDLKILLSTIPAVLRHRGAY